MVHQSRLPTIHVTSPFVIFAEGCCFKPRSQAHHDKGTGFAPCDGPAAGSTCQVSLDQVFPPPPWVLFWM